MNLELSTLLIIIPPILLIEGIFSGSEIALLSADKTLLKTNAGKGSKAAKLALDLANHPEKVLTSTLVVTCLCVILISSIVTLYVRERYDRHVDFYSILIASPLIVLIGELIPKMLYQRYANRFAPLVAYPVTIIYWLLYPFTKVLSLYTTYLSRSLRPIEEILTGKPPTARDELITLLNYGKRESEITASEKEMIKRIFDFKGTQAKHIMMPLIRVEAIEEKASIRDAIERFKIHRHSRMPIYSNRIDNIIGVLEISDLFLSQDSQQSIRPFMSPTPYIAETHLIEDLLTEMKQNETEMVIVVDEYGGAIGILTFEDIVEEIVGEINDEHDDQVADFQELGENRWLFQARMEVTRINEQLQFEIPEGDYETLGGFLLQQFSKLPETGDELYFDTPVASLKFVIRKANDRMVQTVLIEKRIRPAEKS
jgi:putative hemolysin